MAQIKVIRGNLASVPAVTELGVSTIVCLGVLLPPQAKGGSSKVKVHWVSPSAANQWEWLLSVHAGRGT